MLKPGTLQMYGELEGLDEEDLMRIIEHDVTSNTNRIGSLGPETNQNVRSFGSLAGHPVTVKHAPPGGTQYTSLHESFSGQASSAAGGARGSDPSYQGSELEAGSPFMSVLKTNDLEQALLWIEQSSKERDSLGILHHDTSSFISSPLMGPLPSSDSGSSSFYLPSERERTNSSRGRRPVPLEHDNRARQGWGKQAEGWEDAEIGQSPECNCLRLIACSLEKLGTRISSIQSATMDTLLSQSREATAECSAVLQCNRCQPASMLLSMACQYLCILYERIASCFLEKQRLLESSDHIVSRDAELNRPPDPTTTRRTKGETVADDMWFSSYHIENVCERNQVLRCIISLQMSKFSNLLVKLRERTGTEKGHFPLLAEAARRLKVAQDLLDNGTDSL